MAEQQGEEINTTTGQAGQEAQRINVITNPANGALKGNPPFIFNGERSTTQHFMVNFDLFKAINRNNNTMKSVGDSLLLMAVRVNDSLELEVTDPKDNQRDIEQEDGES